MSALIHEFDDNIELCEQLAKRIAGDLETALKLRKVATLAVSGGSTPRSLFAALSRCQLEWSKVLVTQVDERWVAETDPDSNAQLIREELLQGYAVEAQFHSMKVDIEDAFAAEAEAGEQLQAFAEGIDVIVLGMGEDGHTASFFPGAHSLPAALNPNSTQLCVAVRPPVAPHDRMTLTLATLLKGRQRYLHITGEKKLLVLKRALAGSDVFELPVRAVLQAPGSLLEVFYASAS